MTSVRLIALCCVTILTVLGLLQEERGAVSPSKELLRDVVVDAEPQAPSVGSSSNNTEMERRVQEEEEEEVERDPKAEDNNIEPDETVEEEVEPEKPAPESTSQPAPAKKTTKKKKKKSPAPAPEDNEPEEVKPESTPNPVKKTIGEKKKKKSPAPAPLPAVEETEPAKPAEVKKPATKSAPVKVKEPAAAQFTTPVSQNYLRSNTNSPQQTLPNILFIGTQKGGSSSLAGWMFGKKAGVCQGHTFKQRGEPWWYQKEMHFFDMPDRYQQGANFYALHYAHCRNKRYAMDATPDTLRYPERVFQFYNQSAPEMIPQLKILLTVREPIARELSMYNHMQIDVHEDTKDSKKKCGRWVQKVKHPESGQVKTLDEFASLDTLPVLQKNRDDHESSVGNYARYLKRWFKLFDPTQILVLSYDEDIRPGAPAKQKVDQFLDLGMDEKDLKSPFVKSNQHKSPFKVDKVPCSTMARLKPVMDKYNKDLYKLLKNTPRPDMELKPFPQFKQPSCEPDDNNEQESDKTATTAVNNKKGKGKAKQQNPSVIA